MSCNRFVNSTPASRNHPSHRALLLLGAVALLGTAACPAPASFHTARPIKAGNADIGIAAHGLGIVVPATGGTGSQVAGLPNIEFQVRYGVTDWFDFGFKLYPVGLHVDLNFCLVCFDEFALSINPGFQGMGIFSSSGGGFLGYAFLPILMDVVNTDIVTLTLGPKPMLQVGTATIGGTSGTASSGGVTFFIGGMIGLKLQITEVFSIMPEGNVVVNVENGLIIFDGGLSFNFTF